MTDSIFIRSGRAALSDVFAEPAWLAEQLNDPDVRIVEVDVSRAAYAKGHIPGAVHLRADLLRTADGAFKNVAEVRQLFQDRGVVPERGVVTYCTIGIRASEAALVLKYLLGYPDARVYIGSWAEWGTRAETPPDMTSESEPRLPL